MFAQSTSYNFLDSYLMNTYSTTFSWELVTK